MAQTRTEISARYYQKNKEKIIAYQRDWYRKNKWRRNKTVRAWQDKNRERLKELYRRRRDEILALHKAWREANKDRFRALRANNKRIRVRGLAMQLIAKRYRKEILEIYEKCPLGHHVDHIVPLKHSLVCGLHVPWNLQYLPALENFRKRNKMLEECS